MAAITGKDGKVTVGGSEIAQIRSFRIEESADNQTYVTSSTGGWAATAEGARHWTASIDLLLEDGAALSALVVGDKYTFEFYKDATHKLTGDARVNTITGPEVDIEGSGLIGLTVEVTGDGPLTRT